VDGARFKSTSPKSSMQKKALEVLLNHSNSKNGSLSQNKHTTANQSVKNEPRFRVVDGGINGRATTDIPKPKADDVTFLHKIPEKNLNKVEATPSQEAKATPQPKQELKLRLDAHFLHEFAPKIVVVGAGGAGGNALNNMLAKELQGVDFVALNTDAQHISPTDQRLQLGINLTNGLGCSANPAAGRMAAEESREQIQEQLKDAHLVLITAGMGGDTGTGAAPVVADICYEMGILTVGVITLPLFSFEETHRRRLALEGIERLQSVVDTLIVIPNQNLFQIAGPETTFVDAFQMADDVLLGGVKSITDLMTSLGLINLDFADVQVIKVFA
jgi:cell division GTPase FtsZ